MNDNQLPLCVYHKADFDGVCCGALFNKYFRGDCELLGYDYGEPFPWDKVTKDREVYMADVSLPKDDMKRLNETAKKFVWYDHHKTAIDDTAGMDIAGYRVVGHAGCEIVWNNLLTTAPDADMPHVVKLLGRYDVWDHSDKLKWDAEILPFQYGLRTVRGILDPRHALWDTLLSSFVKGSAYVAIGTAILDFQRQQCATIAANGVFERQLVAAEDGTTVRALCLNTPINNSMSLEHLFNPEQHDVMVVFNHLSNGLWKGSIYSGKAGIHCGAIAKYLAGKGGGGHAGAAGFRVPYPVLTAWLKI